MIRQIFRVVPLVLLGTALASIHLLEAQTVTPNDRWCAGEWGESESDQFCEVREFTLEARDLIRVDAEPNGGIRVEGWDRNETRLQAKVTAWSRSGDPEEMAQAIEVQIGNTIQTDGPSVGRREGWSVSYRLMVPANSSLELASLNGGIEVTAVQGDMNLNTENGSIRLKDVGGNVRGRTQNGGLDVHLSGSQWQGDGLDLATINGGVNLVIPRGFRATLTAGTVNGGFHTDFPITRRGRLRSSRITTELNGGGARISVRTTNGGIRIGQW
jgi:hypothetical protein